ncbi:roundabout homolog 2-like [Watersipora subatra]|uniref:roundabout homolog 2-like n=1 Tax=Watersipora subatra TaxID=2589382 RepID=UPI00355AD81E
MYTTFAFVFIFTLVSGGFVKEPSNVVYKRGEQTIGHISCEVSPADSSTLIWQFQSYNSQASVIIFFNRTIVHNREKYSTSNNAVKTGNFTITINNLERNDSGEYTCQVDGMARKATLYVADPPEVPSFSVDTSLVENTTATFTCQHVGGFPQPTYSWLLNGSPVPPERYSDITEGGITRSRLMLMMKNTDDQSMLVCQTSNVLNSTRAGSTLDVQYSPRVSIAEQNLIVLRSQPFTLTCQMALNPFYTELQWFRGSDIISGANTATYIVTGLESDNQFSCLVRNALGTGQGSTSVSVHYGPEVEIEGGDLVVIAEWETLSASCVAKGKPTADIKWKKGNQVLSTSGELEMKSMNRQDRGEYTCVATNVVTPTDGGPQEKSATATLTVTVNYAADTPTLLVSPVSSSGFYSAREKVQLECVTEDIGSPEAQIRWYKSRSQDTPLSVDGATLQIELPQVVDTDEYFCEAVNSVGSVKSNHQLLQFMDVPELLMADPASKDNVSRSTPDYTIQCSYRAFPSASISWHKDGQLLTPGDSYQIQEQQEVEENNYPYVRTDSTLLVHNGGDGVQIKDSGMYSCSAENRAGLSLVTYSKQVNVIYRPSYEGYGKVAANLSSSVSVLCEVSSYPPVSSISFFRDNTDLNAPKYTMKTVEYEVGGVVYRQRREMIISEVTNADYGVYTCVAENNKGETRQEIVLTKTSKPDPPTDLAYSELSWHSVSLSWQPGFDGGLWQTFTVNRLWNTTEVAQNGIVDTEYTLEGLFPRTKYTLRVLANNSKGSSGSYIEQVLTTPDLHIPVAKLVYNENEESINVLINSTEYCTTLQGTTDRITFTNITQCETSLGSVSISGLSYTSYQALTCVPFRRDICNKSEDITMDLAKKDTNKGTIIGVSVAVSVCLLIIIIIVVIFIVKTRRKSRIQKSAKNASKAGHVNPVMTPNGVPGEVHYSSPGIYNVNSDLEMDDEIDALPYGEINYHRESPVQPKQSYENLDYPYASLQKKPSEQNKLNDAAEYEMPVRPSSLNIHDPSSVSDNSEVEDYGEQLPGVYPTDRLAEFLGPDVMALRRLPSRSESGYSTPDSKLKKVVYEVIV